MYSDDSYDVPQPGHYITTEGDSFQYPQGSHYSYDADGRYSGISGTQVVDDGTVQYGDWQQQANDALDKLPGAVAQIGAHLLDHAVHVVHHVHHVQDAPALTEDASGGAHHKEDASGGAQHKEDASGGAQHKEDASGGAHKEDASAGAQHKAEHATHATHAASTEHTAQHLQKGSKEEHHVTTAVMFGTHSADATHADNVAAQKADTDTKDKP